MSVVRVFHKAAGVPLDKNLNDSGLLDVRMNILGEEYKELVEAAEELKTDFNLQSVCHFLKEFSDVQYAMLGLAETFGLPCEEAFMLTHLSNMSKVEGDHFPKTAPSGKVVKGKNYKDPDLTGVAKSVISKLHGVNND